MKDILIEQMELTEAVLSCTDPDQALNVPMDQGWLSPTERGIALLSLEEGDVTRALEILRVSAIESEKLPA